MVFYHSLLLAGKLVRNMGDVLSRGYFGVMFPCSTKNQYPPRRCLGACGQ